MIHTSKKIGIWDQMGHFDIYVKNEAMKELGPLNDEHGIAFFIHLATSTKRLFITAELNENGNGTVLRTDGETPMNHDTKPNECAIGIFGTLKYNHNGKKYYLSLKNHTVKVFWEGIDNFAKAEIFSDPDDDDECIVCYKNKKNAILYPCGHQQTCRNCWNKWKKKQPTRYVKKCPICRQEVLDVIQDKSRKCSAK